MDEQTPKRPGENMIVEGIVKNVMDRLEASDDAPPPTGVEDQARQEAAEVVERHADAPVQAYVPVIAEREVTDRLREQEPADDQPEPRPATSP